MSFYQQIGSESSSPFLHLLAFQNEQLALENYQKGIEETYSSEGDTQKIAIELGPDLLKRVKDFHRQILFPIYPKLYWDRETQTVDPKDLDIVTSHLTRNFANTTQHFSLLFARIFCAVDPILFPHPQHTRQLVLEDTLRKSAIPADPYLQFAPSIFEAFQEASRLGKPSLSSALENEECCSCLLQ
jgi:hypothetical protein